MSQPALSYRLASNDDKKIIRHSWFESYRRGGKAPAVRFEYYDPGQNWVIRQALERGKTTVAYATSVPDEVCGWACIEGDVLHYVYVKHAYRRLGIATELAKQAKFYSQETIPGLKLARKLQLQYNPYYILNLCLPLTR